MQSYLKLLSGLTNGQVLQRLGARGASALLTGETTDSGPVVCTLSSGKKALRGLVAEKNRHGITGEIQRPAQRHSYRRPVPA